MTKPDLSRGWALFFIEPPLHQYLAVVYYKCSEGKTTSVGNLKAKQKERMKMFVNDMNWKNINKSGFWTLLKDCMKVFIAKHNEPDVFRNEGAKLGKEPFFINGGKDILWLDNNDVECFWTDGMPKTMKGKASKKVKYMIRTKSGKDFEVTELTWGKIMNGYGYVLPKDDEE